MRSLLAEVVFTRLHARFLILGCSLIAAIFGLLGPFFQKEFIDILTGSQSTMPVTHFFDNPLTYVLGAFLCVLIAQGFSQLTNFLSAKEALYMQRVFARRLYEKTLNLRVDTMSGRPVGEIVSLYATDVQGATVFLDQTLPAGSSTLFPLILAPFAISYLFDIPLWPTLFLMIGITAFNCFMAFRQSKFFFMFKQLAAERIGLVNEWVQNIRTIRILGWTVHFEKNIYEKRVVETRNRVMMVTNGQTMNAISSSITFVLNVVALGSLIFYSNHAMTSGELLALLWIVAIFLTRPFRQMPWFFTFAFDSWTSLRRLEEFFATQNNQTPPANWEDGEDNLAMASEKWALQVRNLRLSIGKKEVLKNISMNVAHGELIAIVGEVGSGKSLLLLSLLGETGASFEDLKVDGKDGLHMSLDELRSQFAYVPQEGFIMSASLRENVAFLYDIETELDPSIEDSLKLAQFDLSTERVENGLDTEIGERGVNLSGGQRQRVGLARVHYHNAPILLLDDCLSAVDVDTEQRLFDELLMGAWKGRTRIMVTHRLTTLARVDRIFFLQDGKLIDHGRYEELLTRNAEFRNYTMSVAKESVSV